MLPPPDRSPVRSACCPGLYIARSTPGERPDPVSCPRDYRLIRLWGRTEEAGPLWGESPYDFSEATLLCQEGAETAAAAAGYAAPSPDWILALAPELFEGTSGEKDRPPYSFFRYRPREALHLSHSEKETLTACFDDIFTETRYPDAPCHRAILSRHLERMVRYIARFYERQFISREPADEDLLERCDRYLEEYLRSGQGRTAPSDADCARVLGLSASYFTDLLRYHRGYGPTDYYRKKQMDIAREKLRTTDLPAGRIAAALGFPSERYFSLLFKKLTGTTPEAFRHCN